MVAKKKSAPKKAPAKKKVVKKKAAVKKAVAKKSEPKEEDESGGRSGDKKMEAFCKNLSDEMLKKQLRHQNKKRLGDSPYANELKNELERREI